ncbi:hypothetical protein [Neobacillus vireti]|uniref:hypothetical protein n=1 Tax=Neobacillus vireti TaxID=220686 RepID=UPI0012E2564E|nr:hypothetical protein [Neobacillus vireti]
MANAPLHAFAAAVIPTWHHGYRAASIEAVPLRSTDTVPPILKQLFFLDLRISCCLH